MAQMPIPNDWDFTSFCRWAVCWPDSPKWKAILDGLITQPSRGRFWDADTGNIKDTQSAFLSTYQENFRLREVIMACGDSGIADALNAIATALANNQPSATATANCNNTGACGCSGGNGTNVSISIYGETVLTDGTRWPIYSDGPIPTIPESGIPDGYDDLNQYDADKCAKAAKIVGDLIVTLQNMSVLNLATGAIGAVVVLACLVGVISVPYVTIPLLLWALVGNIGITTALGLLANYISNHRDEFVCVLYTEDNLETMTGLLADALDVAIAAIAVEGAIAVAIKSIALWLLNGNTLGILLTSDAKLLYPDANCADCDCALSWYIIDNTAMGEGSLAADGESRVLSSVPGPASRHYIIFQGDCGCEPEGWQVEIESLDGYLVNQTGTGTDPNGDTGGNILDCNDNTLWWYAEMTSPVGTWCGRLFQIAANPQPFTATVRITRGCPEE